MKPRAGFSSGESFKKKFYTQKWAIFFSNDKLQVYRTRRATQQAFLSHQHIADVASGETYLVDLFIEPTSITVQDAH